MTTPADDDPEEAKSRVLKVSVTRGERRLYDAAAVVYGTTRRRWIREALHAKAVEILLAAQNRASRVRPGAILWARMEDGTYQASRLCDGTERVWAVSLADVPAQVSKDCRAWVVDWVHHPAGGGKGFLLSAEGLAFLGLVAIVPPEP